MTFEAVEQTSIQQPNLADNAVFRSDSNEIPVLQTVDSKLSCLPSLKIEQPAKENDCTNYPTESGLVKFYDQVKDSIVEIEATRPGKKAGTQDRSSGSGFFVSKDGHIATASHVVDGFNTVKLRTGDGTVYDAEVKDIDKENGLALLKISPQSEINPLPVSPDSKRFKMHDPVLTMGHPNGWDNVHISEGLVVGATTVGKVTKPEDLKGMNPKQAIVALKSHGETGNSGGPTFDLHGQVSGVAIKASDGARGQHIFIMPVQPLNILIRKNID